MSDIFDAPSKNRTPIKCEDVDIISISSDDDDDPVATVDRKAASFRPMSFDRMNFNRAPVDLSNVKSLLPNARGHRRSSLFGSPTSMECNLSSSSPGVSIIARKSIIGNSNILVNAQITME